ncbi:uncharacterized protein LOC144659429 isoform X3 [Oculina patagonica]
MIYAYAFVLVCLCITQPACCAGSKHQKDLITKSGTPGKEISIDSAAVVDEFDSNECSVKTVDGQSPGQCCHFPFLYKGVEQTSCVKGVTTNRKWCGVTYNYDKEKQWGWCPSECSAKTVDGQCCHFPFLYKGVEQTSCVKGVTTNRKWCGVTYNYDKEKKWGWCPSECSVKTVDGQSPGQCCHFPFLYKGVEQTSCVKGVTTNRKWCGVTYNYDKEKQWGWCPSECSVKTVEGECCKFPFLWQGKNETSCVPGIVTPRLWCLTDAEKFGWCASECGLKTVDGQCCKFPFLYKGIERTSCVKGVTTNRKWCGVTYNYDKDKKWGWCQDYDVTLPWVGANSFLKPSHCRDFQTRAEQQRERTLGFFAGPAPNADVEEECCAEGCNAEEMNENYYYSAPGPKIAETYRERFVAECC